MSEKPQKILYENQQEVWNLAKEILVELVTDKPFVVEALVWASLAEGKFGLYEHEHAGRPGSDIDLVIIADENYAIPEGWGFTGVEKSCFDLYYLGKFYYQGNRHPIDGLIVFPSKHSLSDVQKMIENRSKSIYLKAGQSVLALK